MNQEFIEALRALEKEKGINKDVLIEAIESALVTAYKRDYGAETDVRVQIDRQSGKMQVFRRWSVADEVLYPQTQIPLDQIDHRIEPEDDLRHGKQRQIEHVSQLPVSLLVGQDLLPVVRVIFVGNDHVFSERSRRHHPRQDDHLGPEIVR